MGTLVIRQDGGRKMVGQLGHGSYTKRTSTASLKGQGVPPTAWHPQRPGEQPEAFTRHLQYYMNLPVDVAERDTARLMDFVKPMVWRYPFRSCAEMFPFSLPDVDCQYLAACERIRRYHELGEEHSKVAPLLADTRMYRDALTIALQAGNRARSCVDPELLEENDRLSFRAWNKADAVARELIEKYGPAIFARMDNIAYMYS